jgi:low molecular weight protein-tyrosine phosphatase
MRADNTRKDSFHVVFVCTGNRFRSPLAAALLESAVPDGALRASSRGTLRLGRVAAMPEAVRLAARFGVDLSSHRAASLAAGALADADLVLGFERPHLLAAVMEGQARRERTFTLAELVRLLDEADVPKGDVGARARADRDTAHRARAGRTDLFLPEIEDPIGKPPDVQHAIAERIHVLVTSFARRLAEARK